MADPSRLGDPIKPDPSNKIESNAISSEYLRSTYYLCHTEKLEDFPNNDDNDQPKSAVSCQLPLRAVPKPTVNGGVKAWDITEKFTQASSGNLNSPGFSLICFKILSVFLQSS